MATIKTRRRADGTTRYTAIVRIRKGKAIIYREAKTFSHIAAAKTWARHREVALEDPDTLKQAQEETQPRGAGNYRLSSIIRWYIDSLKAVANWGRTKQTTLEFLEHHPVGHQDARELNCQKLVDHIRARRESGAGPATVANDLIWVGGDLAGCQERGWNASEARSG